MLDLAIKYREQLQQLMYDTWMNEKYKFWNCTNYSEKFELAENTWNYHQFVSVDKDGNVIGYIGYSIDRESDYVCGLNIINFSDNKAVFGCDAGRAIKNIFEKYKFRRLEFSVIIGNPIEKAYDRLVKKYGGRIVGIYEKRVRLIDGRFYDEKLYEVPN